MPRSLDGLRVTVEIAGSPVEVRYRVGASGFGPRSLRWNGSELAFERAHNPYREGGARVATSALRERLREGSNTLEIEIG
jgi:hypothetical protein